MLSYPGFSESNEIINEEIFYSLVFGGKASEMVKFAKLIRKRLQVTTIGKWIESKRS